MSDKKKMTLREAREKFEESAYSAKAGAAGKDLGKPGKNFAKIAKSAGEEYGSAERGKKVAGAILAKIRAKHMKEDSGKGETYDTTSHSPTDAKPVKDKKQTSIVKPVKTHEESIAEAKAPSPIAGTRLISRHVGTDGHHAEVRYNPEWQEHSVHHYHDGKHLGEGPVSYHGDGREGREDATDTAEYTVKNFHVRDGKLMAKTNEEVENLDELSRKIVTSFLDKTQPYNPFVTGDAGKQGHEKGRKLAFSKLSRQIRSNVPATEEVDFDDAEDTTKNFHVKRGKLVSKVNEEAEQIDELSKEFVAKHVKKAAVDMAIQRGTEVANFDATAPGANDPEGAKKYDRAFVKKHNRFRGIDTGLKKLSGQAKVNATEETEADQLDTSLSDVVPGKEGEIYKKTSEKSTAPSKPTGTTTHVVAGKTGEAYNTTGITKRVPALESAIADVMAESFRKRALYEEAANISIVTPEQRQDWMNVEMGKLNFMDYLDKYKV